MRNAIQYWLAVAAASALVIVSVGCTSSEAPALEFTSESDTLQVAILDNVPHVQISLQSNANTMIRCAISLINNDKTAALNTIAYTHMPGGGAALQHA